MRRLVVLVACCALLSQLVHFSSAADAIGDLSEGSGAGSQQQQQEQHEEVVIIEDEDDSEQPLQGHMQWNAAGGAQQQGYYGFQQRHPRRGGAGGAQDAGQQWAGGEWDAAAQEQWEAAVKQWEASGQQMYGGGEWDAAAQAQWEAAAAQYYGGNWDAAAQPQWNEAAQAQWEQAQAQGSLPPDLAYWTEEEGRAYERQREAAYQGGAAYQKAYREWERVYRKWEKAYMRWEASGWAADPAAAQQEQGEQEGAAGEQQEDASGVAPDGSVDGLSGWLDSEDGSSGSGEAGPQGRRLSSAAPLPEEEAAAAAAAAEGVGAPPSPAEEPGAAGAAGASGQGSADEEDGVDDGLEDEDPYASLSPKEDQELIDAEDKLYFDELKRDVAGGLRELRRMFERLDAAMATHSDRRVVYEDKLKAALSFSSLPSDAYSDPAVDLTANPWITPYCEGSFTLAAMLSSGLAGALAPRDERQAVRVLHRAAAAGSGEAQLALADRYLEGRGVPKNVAEGIRRAKDAATSLAEDLEERSGLLLHGAPLMLRRRWMDGSYMPEGYEDNSHHMVSLEMDLADRGLVDGHRQLGYRMLLGQGMERDEAGAFQQFREAARRGDPVAQFNLAYMYMRGVHVAVNVTKAKELMEEAADQDLPAAFNGLGVLYFHGQDGTPANFTRAKEYFERGVELDDPDSTYNLGTMYQGGFGVETNQTRAVQLFERATERGSWRAPYQLMVIFGEGGWGDVPANLTRGVAAYRQWTSHLPHWGEVLHKATAAMEEGDIWGAAVRYALLAEQGCPQALLNLGWLLHRGELEVELEELESAYASSTLSSSGSVGAGGSSSGSGSDSNGADSTAAAEEQEQEPALQLPGEAEQLAAGSRQLQQTAETEAEASAAGGMAGNGTASGGSSLLSSSGSSGSSAVGMSYAEVQHLALELFQRAARQGEEEGMLVAGHMLFDGQRYGLPAGNDHAAAVEHYQRAADKGSVEALHSLAYMHQAGLGVPRDLEAARRLYQEAVDKAEAEEQALAPWLALQWLRLWLAVTAAEGWWLGLLAVMGWGPGLDPSRGGGAAGAGGSLAGAVLAGGRAGALRQVAEAAKGWDGVAVALLTCALTWVLWRKRQVRQRRQQAAARAQQQEGQMTSPPSPQQVQQAQQARDGQQEQLEAEQPPGRQQAQPQAKQRQQEKSEAEVEQQEGRQQEKQQQEEKKAGIERQGEQQGDDEEPQASAAPVDADKTAGSSAS